jgi:hypothetical protein
MFTLQRQDGSSVTRPRRAYDGGALRARRSFGHVLNDQHRGLVRVLVTKADDPQRPMA